ncbi:MAG: gfo/Idh/MocA family oxidoreductase, partial [Phycisphaerales bacterium]
HPYAGKWWVPGLCLGYEHSFVHGLHEFLRRLDDPSVERRYPDFRDALATQLVCDAVLASARERRWIDVPSA